MTRGGSGGEGRRLAGDWGGERHNHGDGEAMGDGGRGGVTGMARGQGMGTCRAGVTTVTQCDGDGKASGLVMGNRARGRRAGIANRRSPWVTICCSRWSDGVTWGHPCH
ncbi:Os12g0232500 [Oryza sativa Japonica Group]|uniref:Os12g0232500 protein n=1 Tax=Oryza sativa subsp. japonica TaxID=39947 RepID=A0A0P0Y8G6_ORYSJ|nr:Os12g0232500 [Oryza sativa Japonica Group]